MDIAWIRIAGEYVTQADIDRQRLRVMAIDLSDPPPLGYWGRLWSRIRLAFEVT